MAICDPRIRFLSKVPEDLLLLLKEEQVNWNHLDTQFWGRNPVFLRHSTLLFKSHNSKKISPVLDWCKQIVGDDTVVMQAMLNAIPPGMICPAHVDTLQFHLNSRRLHIPILNSHLGNHITFERVNDLWKASQWHMEEGMLWELDNIRPHAVENTGNDWRINFIVDIMPKELYQADTRWYTANESQSKYFYQLEKEFSKDTILSRWSYSKISQTL